MTVAVKAPAAVEDRVMVEACRAFASAIDAPGATVLRVAGAPDSPMLNRVVGLGVERPATEADVDEALALVEPGVAFYVAVAATAQPPQLAQWLQARGLQPGWGWMTFRRGVGDPPAVRTDLSLVEVDGPAAAAAFARVVRMSYELPEAVDEAIAGVPDAGWRCWLALDGAQPVAAAGLYAAHGAAYLGLAGTLPGHRGKGAQNALLAARIRCAARLGCGVMLTETGERRVDRPSRSYRNILRAGFAEADVTANWLGRR